MERNELAGGSHGRKEWMKENSKIISELKSGNPQIGIKTLDEIEKEIADKGRILREEYGSVASRATPGKRLVGTLLGAMRGSFNDPLVLGTLWMGATRSAGILRSAVIGFGVGAGTELAIQPLVYDYKKKIDSPYSFNEAALNVLAVGIGGAIFEGGIKSLIKGYDLLKAKGKIKTTPDTDAARDVLNELDEVMEASPFDNSKPENRDAHVKAFDKAAQDIGEGKRADVSEIVRPIEKGQPETVPAGKSFLPEEGGGYRQKDLDYIELRVKEGEPGRRSAADVGGEFINTSSASTYPKWFQNKGYTRKETLNAIKKVRRGKKLTDRQAAMLDDLVAGSRTEAVSRIQLAKRYRDEPQSVNEADIEVGDKFKRYGEKYEKVADTEEGGSILKDGEIKVIGPFEEVAIDRGAGGIKKTKSQRPACIRRVFKK